MSNSAARQTFDEETEIGISIKEMPIKTPLWSAVWPNMPFYAYISLSEDRHTLAGRVNSE
jgi:hypothetical protein